MTDLRKLPLTLGLPAALLLGAVATFRGPAPQDAPRAAAPSIAVVDIDQVLKSYAGAEVKQEEWTAMEAGFQARMDDLKGQAREAMSTRETYDEGTEERWRADLYYELKRIEYEETAKIFSAKADRFRLDIGLDLYSEIQRGIAQFAKQQGLQLVLRIRPDNVAAPKTARLETNQQRDVLFHDPKVDVTDDVIRFLKTWDPEPGK